MSEVEYSAESLAYNDFKPATTEAALFQELESSFMGGGGVLSAPWHQIDTRKMITMAGQPCLEIRWHYKNTWMEEDQAKHEAEARARETPQMREARERAEREMPPELRDAKLKSTVSRQEEHVARVLVIGNKVFVLGVSANGAKLNEADVNMFFDSFEAK